MGVCVVRFKGMRNTLLTNHLPCVPRWHFYTAPKRWQSSLEEELEVETELTTAPSVKFHPDMCCNRLATLFEDLSMGQQEAAAAKKSRKG